MGNHTWLCQTFDIDEQLVADAANNTECLKLFRRVLSLRINDLIQHDFEKLKWILYRIDINEQKLGDALKNATGNAAEVMADMIIERQLEKAESRRKNGAQENDWDFDL